MKQNLSERCQIYQKLVMSTILIIIICSSGCFENPKIPSHTSDKPDAIHMITPTMTLSESTGSIHPETDTNLPNVNFPPDMPPQVREQLIREGRIPILPENIQHASFDGDIHDPEPISQFIGSSNRPSDNTFFPSRESIYFSETPVWSRPSTLYPMYTQSGLLLNSTITTLEIQVEKGPFEVRYTVHPKGNPLVSWAKITILDQFLNQIYEEGYNRNYSSEQRKEFTIYKEGRFTIEIIGALATMDISIHTPDGTIPASPSGTLVRADLPDDIPPHIRERLMREGRI